jgi:hypothetical protein
MAEIAGLDILGFIVTKPEVVWSISLIGAVCVVGVVDYLRCFFEKKKNVIRWVVLFLSLIVAVVFSPIVPSAITTIFIIWLLILSIATIAKKALIDGIPILINKVMGVSTNNKGG